MAKVDRVLHEPTRFVLAAILYSAENADFNYLLNATQINRGTLSSHLTRLEEVGYVQIEKTYRAKTPQTIYALTRAGRNAFRKHYEQLQRAAKHMPKRASKGELRFESQVEK